jgi:hypothetical protein
MIEIIRTNVIDTIKTRESTNPIAPTTTTVDDERMTRLAHDFFLPGPFDVICARGKEARNHNQQFRKKIKESVNAYAEAETKLYKSLVVSSVVEWFRKASPNGGFVKELNGVWYEVGDHLTREKVGQALRDRLHSHYKSSTKAKRRRWKKEEQEKFDKEEYLDNMINANQFISVRMKQMEERRNDLGGNDASDESLLKLFTQNNCFILKAIRSDQNLQEHIKSFSS